VKAEKVVIFETHFHWPELKETVGKQGRSQPNTAGKGEKSSGGAKFLPYFLKFEVKIGAKARKKQKHNICCLLLLCYFSR